MGWSAAVSFASGGAQLVAVIFLVFRNQHYDRVAGLSQLPIMWQEFFSGMLWVYEGKDSDTCPDENYIFSYLTHVSFGLVPTAYCFAAYWISDTTDQLGNKWRRHALAMLTVWSFLGYVGNVFVYRIFFWEPYCAHAGPCGLLDWPSNYTPWVRQLLQFCFFTFVLIPPIVRPSDGRKYKWFCTGVVGIALVTFVPTYVYTQFSACTNGEQGSMWCWLNSSVCLWYVTETWLYRFLIDKSWRAERRPCCPPPHAMVEAI